MERKKIVWIQIMQAWTMLLVVIGHSCILGVGNGPDWETVIYRFAQPFRMPLFILISGLLFSMTRALPIINEGGGYKWQYIPMLKDKAIRLLIPFVFTTFVAFALKIAFPGEMSRQVSLSFHEIVHAFLYPNDNPMRELWFIATIFWMFIMMPIWRFTFKKNYYIVITILVLCVFYKYHPNIDFLCIKRFFRNAIWFYLGMVIFKCEIINKYCSPNKLITFLGGALLYLIGYYIDRFFMSLGGMFFSIALALAFDKYYPSLFITFRKYTYQIFLLGIYAQMFVKIIYRHVSMPYILAYLLCILVGLYVPVIISKILERLNWAPLLLCVGLKKKSK